MQACRGETPAHTPVWFMRQAGRSLPEYRARRGTESILVALRTPELAAELTLQPVRRHGVDAAILYSDIVVTAHAVGFGVDIAPGVGPVTEQPFTSFDDLQRLVPFEPGAHAPWMLETIRILSKELAVPLIGFAGAPFTVASYLIEGRPSKDHARTKSMMLTEPKLFDALLERLADHAIASLRAQVDAGASAVQLFDSWVGTLNPQTYGRVVAPHSTRIFEALRDLDVPRIHFGINSGELLRAMADCGASVVGVDWRTPLDAARQRIGRPITLQGNLDPAVCLAPFEVVASEAREVLARANGPHIFNLGHGVLPQTPPDTLTQLVELVHQETQAK
jgi:uroporphyrinogen decarboxylase